MHLNKNKNQIYFWAVRPERLFDFQTQKILEKTVQERIRQLENIILVFQIAYQIPRGSRAGEKCILKKISDQSRVQIYLQMKEHLRKMKNFRQMLQNQELLFYHLQHDRLFFLQLYNLKEIIQMELPRLSCLLGSIKSTSRQPYWEQEW